MSRLRPLVTPLLLWGLFALVAPVSAPAAEPGSSDAWFAANLDELIGLYKHLHSHPELSFHEVNTAARVADELRKAGAQVTTGVGQHGVVGVLKNGPGPTVLVRTDLDALPVVEETGLPYASKVRTTDDEGKDVGVMHACGHDVHMTCLVGTARWLAEHKDRWSGTVLFIGQPAEERGSGAKAMLADGLYERFGKPNFAVALHVTHDQPPDELGYTSGPALAGSTSVDVLIKGKGGHGAAPHATIDPIVLAAMAIVDLQTIVSREVDPVHPAVLTVGSIHGGTKHNIIPAEVKLQLTLRAYRDDVRDLLIDGIKRRVTGLARAHRAPEPVVTIQDTTPPTVNTPSLVARLVPVLGKELGTSKVKEVEPVMGAEDFGRYGQGGVPTFMIRLGTIPPQRIAQARTAGEPLPSLHSPFYHPDPAPSVRTGIRSMTAVVLDLLPARP